MPKFLTIGYGDREGYDRTPKPLRDAAHAQDEELQRNGALMGIAGSPQRSGTTRLNMSRPKKAPAWIHCSPSPALP